MGEVADRGVREALAGLASRAKPQAAGVACAFAGASAAALLELTAGLAADRIIGEAGGAGGDPPGVTEARLRELHALGAKLRERLLAAADEDALAYTRVIASRQGAARAAALSRASDPPLAIAEGAAEVATAAAEVAASGTWAFTADALVAVELARAGARGAAALVEANLAGRPDDRIARARAAVQRVEQAQNPADR